MDDEGYEMDRDSSMTFHSARKDLARLLRGWVVRGPVEILAHWLGEEPLPAAPLGVSVNRLIRNPASFRCSGTPYDYLVRRGLLGCNSGSEPWLSDLPEPMTVPMSPRESGSRLPHSKRFRRKLAVRDIAENNSPPASCNSASANSTGRIWRSISTG